MSPLPSVNIAFENGNIGGSLATPDGVFGMILPWTSLQSGTSMLIKSLSDAVGIGIDQVNEPRAYRALKQFYDEAGTGTKLWIIDSTAGTGSNFSLTGSAAAKLMQDSNGEISMIFDVYDHNASGLLLNNAQGIEQEIVDAISVATAFAENSAEINKKPVIIVLEAYNPALNPDGTVNVAALIDLTQQSSNRTAVLMGNELPVSSALENGLGTAIGTLAGRLAATQVQRNIGRVKDGPVRPQMLFLGDKLAEASDLDAIHEKGYITFRRHVGKAGYFFSDDPTATATTDDFRFLNRLRVIDKAYRIAFGVLTEYILDEVPLNADGTINAIYAKSIEGHVERELVQLMTSNGELSGDPTDNDDNGVVVQVDTTNNVAQSSTINVTLRVRPFGHARFFEVSLGFDINANNV
ncbi:MAG: hypothetical protein KKC03_06150 [Bacteroidetes bacterium]|nr:hypothetical protein [Bacteroidota bacterium]